MNFYKTMQKVFSGVFAAGATVAMGFLSFAGMFIISPGLGLCLTALVLAIAFEGQVYHEGISKAIRRMFDKNYLKKGIADREISKQIKIVKRYNRTHGLPPDHFDNMFLASYQELKGFIDLLEHAPCLTNELAAKKEEAEEQLEELKSAYIEQLTIGQLVTQNQQAINQILSHHSDDLLAEIKRKQWLISFTWVFAIAGGISSGFAALSAIQDGVATLAASSALVGALPGGVVVALAVFAAFGYTFMLYQTMSDVIQQYNGKIQDYCKAREGEQAWMHILRLVGIGLVIALGVFATVATAGTWWYATNRGALLFNFGATTAKVIRNVSVTLMTVPTLIYNVSNSLITIEKISRSYYLAAAKNVLTNIYNNARQESFLKFINPFRFLAIAIDSTINAVLFIGHIVSMGLISDRLAGVSPVLTALLIAINEALVDLRYLGGDVQHDEHHDHGHGHGHAHGHGHHHGHDGGGDNNDDDNDDHDHGHNHSHDSILSVALLMPFTAIVAVCKAAAYLWDVPLVGSEAAWNDYFPPQAAWQEPKAPSLIKRWISSEFTINSKMKSAVPEVQSAPAATTPASFALQNSHRGRFHEHSHGHGHGHGHGDGHSHGANDHVLTPSTKALTS